MQFDRSFLVELVGELLGTFVLMFLGEGSTASFHAVSGATNWIQLCCGWALAVFLGVLVSIKLSGAHLNFAVTVSMASLKKFDFQKVPFFFLSQVLGAFLGTGLVHLLYYNFVRDGLIPYFAWETGRSNKVPLTTAFFTEFILTGLLLLAILVVTDENITGKFSSLKVSGVVALTVLSIGICFGSNTGFAINPSRDLGARLVSLIAKGTEAFSRDNYYFWVPLVAPVVGGVFVSCIYTYLVKPLMVVEPEEQHVPEKTNEIDA